MRNYREENQKVKVLETMTCDVCKKTYTEKDWEETQEFHCIDFVGGYGSIFGDGVRVQCDICQHCLNDLIGSYIRVVGNQDDFEG